MRRSADEQVLAGQAQSLYSVILWGRSESCCHIYSIEQRLWWLSRRSVNSHMYVCYISHHDNWCHKHHSSIRWAKCQQTGRQNMTSLQSIPAALKNRFELIWSYFVERWTNVFTESVNHKIKLIKRRTFGFTWIVEAQITTFSAVYCLGFFILNYSTIQQIY